MAQPLAAPSDNGTIAVDEFEIARATNLSVAFLRRDRRTLRLIPYFKIGKRCLYNLQRVREALNAFEQGGPKRKAKSAATPA